MHGDAQDDQFLEQLLEAKWGVIVDFMVYDTAKFAHRAPKLLAGTNQYVFLSSARVYAGTCDSITEDSPRLLDEVADKDFLETSDYSLAKARQENILRDSGKRNWTIIRPLYNL